MAIRESLLAYHGNTGGPIEVRAIEASPAGKPKVVSRVCRSLEEAVREAERFEADGLWNVYFTPNELPADLEGAATDSAVVNRRWLLVDVDPVRPTKVSATDEEKSGALEVARAILAYLTANGVPREAVIFATSGNGFHLSVSTEAPNTEATRDTHARILERLGGLFDTDRAQVDRSVFNAARIWRVPGTHSRKGTHTDERPHRPAEILEVELAPSPRDNPVPWEVLEALFEAPPEAERITTVEGALSLLGLSVRKTKKLRQTAKQSAGVLYSLSRCPLPLTPPHDVDDGAFLVQWADGSAYVKCQHARCINAGLSPTPLSKLLKAAGHDASAWRGSPSAPPPPDESGRIDVVIGNHVRVEAEAQAEIAAADVVFRRPSGEAILLARHSSPVSDHGVEHAAGTVSLRPVTVPALGAILSSRVRCWKSKRPAEFPERWLRGMLDLSHQRGRWRRLLGVSCLPLVDLQTGALSARPGYHESGFWLETDWAAEGLEEPLSDTYAREYLEAPFRGWLDLGDVKPGAVVAATLTAVLRASLTACPLVAIEAPRPGSGKSLLATALGVIATGAVPSTIVEGHDEAELEKRIASAILSSAPAINLDNITRPLRSSALASAVSQGVATIRLFGQLNEVTVPARSLWFATFNNASVSPDLLRRSLSVAIIPSTNRPAAREFDFDPVARATEQRRRIVGAALALIRRQILSPSPHATVGSFADWARIVDGICQRLYGYSPANEIMLRLDSDASTVAEESLLRSLVEWQEALGLPSWSVGETLEAPVGPPGEPCPQAPLGGAWEPICPKGREGYDRQFAGRWVASHRHTVTVDSSGRAWRLMPANEKGPSNRWRFEPLD